MIKIRNLIIAFSGIATVAFFLAALVIGSILYPNYVPVSQEISVLFALTSPTRSVITPLFLLYEIATLLFVFGLFLRSAYIYARVGSFFLFLNGVAGIIIWWFPMDPMGTPLSQTGSIHLLLVAIMCTSITFGIVFFGIAFRHMINMRWLSHLSFVFAVVLTSSATTAVLSVITRNTLLGLLERMPIATFFAWILFVSIGMLFSDHRIKHYLPSHFSH